MRGVARRLGSLAGNAGLLAFIGVVCFAAAGADAAPEPLRFAVSVSGTAHDVWDFTGGPTEEGACVRRARSEGIRDVRFRTTKPTVVRVSDGRLLATMIRNLAGTVTLAGANTTTLTCGGEGTQTIADCARTRRSFRNATVRARGTRPGSVTVGPVRATLRRSNCPLEPADVLRQLLGTIPSPLRVSTASLANPRIARITVNVSGTRRRNYGPEEAGTLRQRAKWRVTLARLSP